MSLKVSRVVACISTIILAFIFHFAYNLIPNFITSIFFPVNESIWEHMKLLYTSILVYGIIDYFLNIKFNLKYNNFFFNLFFLSYSSVVIYLLLFLPIYYSIGENMFISIGIMIITFIVVYVISYYILIMCSKKCDFLWVMPIILGYFLFGFLTYNPIRNQLFFDTKDELYGIKK